MKSFSFLVLLNLFNAVLLSRTADLQFSFHQGTILREGDITVFPTCCSAAIIIQELKAETAASVFSGKFNSSVWFSTHDLKASQLAWVIFHFVMFSDGLSALSVMKIGKWLLSWRSSSGFHVSRGNICGSQKLRSIAENVWDERLKWVLEPLFRRQRSAFLYTFSMIFPLPNVLCEPHKELWALKSPVIMKGGVSWEKRFISSASETEEFGEI